MGGEEERGGDNKDGRVVARFTARTFQIVFSRPLQTRTLLLSGNAAGAVDLLRLTRAELKKLWQIFGHGSRAHIPRQHVGASSFGGTACISNHQWLAKNG